MFDPGMMFVLRATKVDGKGCAPLQCMPSISILSYFGQTNNSFKIDLGAGDPALYVILGLSPGTRAGSGRVKAWTSVLQYRLSIREEWRTLKSSRAVLRAASLGNIQLRAVVLNDDGKTVQANVTLEAHPGHQHVRHTGEGRAAAFQNMTRDLNGIDFELWREHPDHKAICESERLPVVPAFLLASDVSNTNHSTNVQLRELALALEHQKQSTAGVTAVLERSCARVKAQEDELQDARLRLREAEDAATAATLQATAAVASAEASQREAKRALETADGSKQASEKEVCAAKQAEASAEQCAESLRFMTDDILTDLHEAQNTNQRLQQQASAARSLLQQAEEAQRRSLQQVQALEATCKDCQINVQEVRQNLEASRLEEERLEVEHRHRQELAADDIARLQQKLREATKQAEEATKQAEVTAKQNSMLEQQRVESEAGAQQARKRANVLATECDRFEGMDDQIGRMLPAVRECLIPLLQNAKIGKRELSSTILRVLRNLEETSAIAVLTNFFGRNDLGLLQSAGTLVCVMLLVGCVICVFCSSTHNRETYSSIHSHTVVV